MQLTAQEKILVNGWQRGFPLVPRPYAQIAEEMTLGEQDVITMLASLKERGILTRVGAVVRPNTVGASSLVAMAIPVEELDDVADIVCREPLVNHNYERENELNLWFVVTASSITELDEVLAHIEQKSGHQTIKLPLEKAFHIDLGFKL
jgi:DNA-binding Lrp family transcriptional regulator